MRARLCKIALGRSQPMAELARTVLEQGVI